jgi:hypothetical protein
MNLRPVTRPLRRQDGAYAVIQVEDAARLSGRSMPGAVAQRSGRLEILVVVNLAISCIPPIGQLPRFRVSTDFPGGYQIRLVNEPADWTAQQRSVEPIKRPKDSPYRGGSWRYVERLSTPDGDRLLVDREIAPLPNVGSASETNGLVYVVARSELAEVLPHLLSRIGVGRRSLPVVRRRVAALCAQGEQYMSRYYTAAWGSTD